MRKLIPCFAAAAFAFSLAGCSTIQSIESNLASPTTTQAVANVKAVAVVVAQTTVALICDVSAVSNVATQIEVAAGANVSTIGTTGKVYSASTAACTGLGGLVSGTTTVAAGTTVIQ